ncbi:MAG: DUF2029 domain-containing protein [Verrucomicrobiales bacterium]|nr:DUF2029 domain-containing protein [Verrucomicrobiales bacterium]
MKTRSSQSWPDFVRQWFARHSGVLCVLLVMGALLVVVGRLGLKIKYGGIEGVGIDFRYTPVKLLVAGHDPFKVYLGQLETLRHGGNLEVPKLDISDRPSTGPVYLVSGYLPLLPLVLTDMNTAKYIWMALTAVMFGAVILTAQRTLALNRWWLAGLTAALLLSSSFMASVYNCQMSMLALCTFMLAARFSKKHWLLAALLLSVSWTKFSLTVPLTLWFLLAPTRWKIVLVAGVWQVLFTALAAWWTGGVFADMLLGPLQLLSIGSSPTMQCSVYGICTYVLGLGQWCSILVTALWLVLAGGWLWWRCGGGKNTEDLASLTLVFLCVVVCSSFYLGLYDFLMLTLPLWWFAKTMQSGGKGGDFWLAALGLGCVLTVIYTPVVMKIATHLIPEARTIRPFNFQSLVWLTCFTLLLLVMGRLLWKQTARTNGKNQAGAEDGD